jgi:hypothetical protein
MERQESEEKANRS